MVDIVDVKDVVLPKSIKAMLATLIFDRVRLYCIYVHVLVLYRLAPHP